MTSGFFYLNSSDRLVRLPTPPPVRRASPLGDVSLMGVLAIAYYVAARFGLALAFVNASATPVWPPAGIALAALILLGYRVWPGIFVGAFLANFATTGSLATSLVIAAGNAGEALLGAYLVIRFARGRRALERAPDIARFVVLAGLLSTMVSATTGVTTLALGGLAPWSNYPTIWLTWWLGDAAGDVVVAPVLLLWAARPHLHWTRLQAAEAVMLLGSLTVVGIAVFGGASLSGATLPGASRYPLEFICTPFLIWAAYRFGPREAATAVLLLAAIATRGTLNGNGPFWRGEPNDSLLLLQVFNGVSALMSLVLAAVVREREQVEVQLRRLAVTDALTGLANYRQLMEVLDAEIQRSHRTARSFAILFLDLNELKKINDSYGHVVGSRALVRVGHAMKRLSRSIDTAARFGGDEFALVLPESDEESARRVADRISAELAMDGDAPPVSVSVGVAVYPRDGQSAEALLASADALLYNMKSSSRAPRGLPNVG